MSASTPRIVIEFFGPPRGLQAVTLRDGSYHYLTAIGWVCFGVSIFSVDGLGRDSGLVLIHLTIAEFLLRFHRFSTNDCRRSGLRRRCLHSSSAEEVFALVDCHSEVDVDIWTSTLASTSSQLDEKVAELLCRRGPDQPSSSSLARRVRVQLLLLSLLLFVR